MAFRAVTHSLYVAASVHTGQSPPNITRSGPNTASVWLTMGARSSADHWPGLAEATMPETLQTTFFRRATSSMPRFHAERSLACTSALPQWSRMKRVSGQASVSLAPSVSSPGRRHRS